MQLLARRQRRQRLLWILTALLVAAAVAFAVWPDGGSGDGAAASAVPTVPIALTPVDIECLDRPGTANAAIDEWYPADAAGAIALDAEITMSSVALSRLADLVLDAAAQQFGGYSTSAIRDLSPDPAYCTTHHYVEVRLDDGSELVVYAWRSAAAAAPRTLPNEAEFVVADGTNTMVSSGPHLVSVLAVAPDGTSVLVSAFGVGARQGLTAGGQFITVPLDPESWGQAPATTGQLTPLATDALALLTRLTTGS